MGYKAILTGMVALAMTGPAFAGPRDPQLVPKPGAEPQMCIPLTQIRESIVRDDRTIDFRLSGRKIMRSSLPNSCPQLGFERRFTYSTGMNQLCSTDIITVLTGAGTGLMRGASCGLGHFQEMVKAPTDAASAR